MADCPDLSVADQSLQIRMPGSATLQVMSSETLPTNIQITKNLLSQAGAALSPIIPIFNILDAMMAIQKFTESVPELIEKPDAVIEAVAEVAEKYAKLFPLIPQVAIPVLTLDAVDTIIAAIKGIVEQLDQVITQQQKIADAEALAALPGNEGLQEAIDCANDVNDKIKEGIASGLGPLNPIIGMANILLEQINIDPIPEISGEIPPDAGDTIDLLNDAITQIELVRSLIPA